MIKQNLLDYIRLENIEDLHHSLFPEHTYPEMKSEWGDFSSRIIPVLHLKLNAYLDTLYIPHQGEIVIYNVFPDDMHVFLAAMIDQYAPDWNIVQRTLAFKVFINQLYDYAQADVKRRKEEKCIRTAGDN
jgi:hypothetical protein